MSRNISATYVSASVTLVQPYYAAYMNFSSGSIRLWTGDYDKSINDDFGNGTYLGVGTLGSISTISETTEIAAKGLDLTLSGIPTEYVSLALSDNYRGREMALYLMLFNSSLSTYQQITIFRGRMDQLVINETGTTSTITVKCESRLIDLNRVKDTRYTDEAQRALYPNDTGLRFVAAMADKSIYWGNSAPSSTGNSGGGGDTGGGDGSTNGSE
jgi:hypothetical protein